LLPDGVSVWTGFPSPNVPYRRTFPPQKKKPPTQKSNPHPTLSSLLSGFALKREYLSNSFKIPVSDFVSVCTVQKCTYRNKEQQRGNFTFLRFGYVSRFKMQTTQLSPQEQTTRSCRITPILEVASSVTENSRWITRRDFGMRHAEDARSRSGRMGSAPPLGTAQVTQFLFSQRAPVNLPGTYIVNSDCTGSNDRQCAPESCDRPQRKGDPGRQHRSAPRCS